MRLVHLADTHLGLKQYTKVTGTDAISRRAGDAAATFARVIDQVIRIAPDVVVIAGDVFDLVNPPHQFVVQAEEQLDRLLAALPGLAVVIAGGNHEVGHTRDVCVLQHLSRLGVHIADRDARRFTFPDLGLSILAVPDAPKLVRPALVPDPDSRFNVLVLHGEAQGLPAHIMKHLAPGKAISLEELGAERFDYVALGHYHVCHQVAPNAWYSGSIEYSSSDPWGELRTEAKLGLPGKGFIERDLVTGRHTFHPVQTARPFIDLEPIEALAMTPSELDAAIRERVDGCASFDGAVVRLVVRDCSTDTSRELDRRAIREHTRRAFRFDITWGRPPAAMKLAAALRGRVPTLEEMLAEILGRRAGESGLDRDELVTKGLEYLAAAGGADEQEAQELPTQPEPVRAAS